MASQTFSYTDHTVADPQTTTSITLAAGEAARVRFTTFEGSATVSLGITRNSVTSYLPITSEDLVYYGAAISGDAVFVKVELNNSADANVAGILESVS